MKTLSFEPQFHVQIKAGQFAGAWTARVPGLVEMSGGTRLQQEAARAAVAELRPIQTEGGEVVVPLDIGADAELARKCMDLLDRECAVPADETSDCFVLPLLAATPTFSMRAVRRTDGANGYEVRLVLAGLDTEQRARDAVEVLPKFLLTTSDCTLPPLTVLCTVCVAGSHGVVTKFSGIASEEEAEELLSQLQFALCGPEIRTH